MKPSVRMAIALLLLAVLSSIAQTSETFDLTTFRPPAGFKREVSESSIRFSKVDEGSGAFCLITLFKSIPTLASSKENFDSAWRTLVRESLGVTAPPQMQPANNPEGWKAEMGSAPFEKDGIKGVAVLVNVSGHGRMVNVLILTNSESYESAITGFLESTSLKLPKAETAPAITQAASPAVSIEGTWAAGTSGVQRSDDYKNPYSVNGYGYGKAQYTFNANGTYDFYSKTFRMTNNNILLVKEHGTFQISGNNITITPQTSVIQAWSKRDGTDKFGKLLTTQSRRLEKVTYQFTKHYFSGIQIWNLVLQAQAETERDGRFSTNTTFSNAWYYAPISPNNTAIDLPN
jgi:hypothetical protein